MTVHGAKGLEAPIVILPDTAVRQEGAQPAAGRCGSPTASRPGGCARDEAPPAVAEAEAARRALVREENRRLLYVALTRAKTLAHRLRRRRRTATARAGTAWSREAMAALGAATRARPRRRRPRARRSTGARARRGGGRSGPRRAAPRCPDWARRAGAGAARAPRRSISPSGLGGAHVPAPARPTGAARPRRRQRRAARRCTGCSSMLHGRPAAERAARSPRGCCPGEPDLPALLAEAAAVLDAPALAPLFGPDSLAEVDGRGAAARARRRVASSAGSTGWSSTAGARPRRRLQEQPRRARRRRRRCPRGSCGRWAPTARRSRQIWPGRTVETAVLWTRAARADAAAGRAGRRGAGPRRGPTLTDRGATIG